MVPETTFIRINEQWEVWVPRQRWGGVSVGEAFLLEQPIIYRKNQKEMLLKSRISVPIILVPDGMYWNQHDRAMHLERDNFPLLLFCNGT
jgi:hypothetical protein